MESKLEICTIESLENNISKLEEHNNIKNNLDINDFIQYKFCCSNTTKGFVTHMCKFIISLLIIFFCIYMIVNSDVNTDNSIHYSLLSSIISVYIHPLANNDDKN